MSTLDTLEDVAEKIIVKIVANGIGEAVTRLLDLALGHGAADDGDKASVARAALAAAANRVEMIARNKLAAEHLEENLANMIRVCERVSGALVPDGSIPDIGVVTTVCTLTRETYDALLAVITFDPPDRDVEGCVAVFEGTPIVLGDADRNLPKALSHPV